MSTTIETITSLKPINLNACSANELAEYFVNAWQLQEELFRSLVLDQVLYLNPDPLRNPLVFYLGHPAAFFINKLRLSGVLTNHVNADFEQLFAAGVDPETPAELSKAKVAWPSAEKVWEFRARCFEVILDLILRMNTAAISSEDPIWAILMGIEHDRIHFETSSMLIRQLPCRLLEKPGGWSYGPSFGDPPPNRMINVPPTTVALGKPRTFPTYGWDNEYGDLRVEVPSFYASKYLISNRAFSEFVEDGCYGRRPFWEDEAWNWNRKHMAVLPRFWIVRDGQWLYRTVFEEIPMPWDWPVEVNHHEATAFCKWKGMGTRLLSEAEWNAINRRSESGGSQYEADNGLSGQFNLNLKFGSPTPVQLLKGVGNSLGFYDLMGNVWVWLSDNFHALPGFQPHYLYEDFSIPFFDKRHSMMLGGSWATTGCGASRFYRLWFRRNFYQHAGFRIASSWGLEKTMRVTLR